MDENKTGECHFNKWVDGMAAMLKERHGANIVVLIHMSPGSLEAVYSNADPVIAQGILKSAQLALDEQVKAAANIVIQAARSGQPEQLFNDKDKLKVN